jgi:hypothetical protein
MQRSTPFLHGWTVSFSHIGCCTLAWRQTTQAAVHTTATQEDYLKLWKALFYCVWYSDKVPVQQELIFNLSRLVRKLHSSIPRATQFVRAFFQTMLREWMGLDHHRLDKFMSLIRRMVNECIFFIKENKWAAEAVAAVTGILANPVLSSQPNGIRYHVVDVFIDEIAAATPSITTPQIQQLIIPFLAHCIKSDDKILFDKIVKDLLSELFTRAVEVHARESTPAEPTSSAGSGSKSQSPLQVDAHERERSMSVAFKNLALAPLAKDVFSIAALRYAPLDNRCSFRLLAHIMRLCSLTQQSHRESLYALRKQLAKAAVAMKEVPDDKACLPSPVTAVTPLVAQVVLIIDPKLKLTVESPAPSMSGIKRKFKDGDASGRVAHDESSTTADGSLQMKPPLKRGRKGDLITEVPLTISESTSSRHPEEKLAPALKVALGSAMPDLPASKKQRANDSTNGKLKKDPTSSLATFKPKRTEPHSHQKVAAPSKDGSQKMANKR